MRIEPAPDDIPTATEEASQKAWLLTFTDTVSLMLTFFIMLYSMSSISGDRWKEISDSLSQTLNPIKMDKAPVSQAVFNIGTIFRRQAVNLDYLGSVLAESAAREPLLAQVQFVRMEDRLVLALPGDILFEPGRAIMTEKAREALFGLGGLLRNVGNNIGVTGHSDPAPPPGQDFASNWELTLGRAAAVANALRRAGYPHDIMAFGAADSRYGDLSTLPEAKRQVLAQRVDIAILDTARDDD